MTSDAGPEIPAWKQSPVVAGAMLLIKGYVPTVTTCDHCGRVLAKADGFVDVTFKGREARFPCPHCRGISVRAFVRPEPT